MNALIACITAGLPAEQDASGAANVTGVTGAVLRTVLSILTGLTKWDPTVTMLNDQRYKPVAMTSERKSKEEAEEKQDSGPEWKKSGDILQSRVLKAQEGVTITELKIELSEEQKWEEKSYEFGEEEHKCAGLLAPFSAPLLRAFHQRLMWKEAGAKLARVTGGLQGELPLLKAVAWYATGKAGGPEVEKEAEQVKAEGGKKWKERQQLAGLLADLLLPFAENGRHSLARNREWNDVQALMTASFLWEKAFLTNKEKDYINLLSVLQVSVLVKERL